MTAAEDNANNELMGLRVVWGEAERRIYPLATTATDLYTAAVHMIREVANGLGDVPDHATLVARWASKDDDLAGAVDRLGTELPPGVPADQVVGAAYGLRDREIALEVEERDRTDRVAAARADFGTEWVTLHERGDIAAGLANPYQCIEYYLANSLALVSTVEQNPSTGGANYVTSVVEMDKTGAEVVEIDVAGLEDREANDAVSFAKNRDELRGLMAKHSA